MTEASTDPAEAASAAELRELAGRLHSTAIHLLRRVRAEDRGTGLTPARLSALSVLVFGGPRSLGELADAEQVTPPTMSRLAGALVDEGLVSREPDPEDGRSVVLRATPEGRRLLEEGRERRVERLRALLEELGPDDREAARAACSALEGALATGTTGGEEGPGDGG
jgi:DNA-binding MarR family transcriptional regulator